MITTKESCNTEQAAYEWQKNEFGRVLRNRSQYLYIYNKTVYNEIHLMTYLC